MLDLRVAADPVSCRAVGEWLGGLAVRMRDSEDVITRARTDSRDCWAGSTGDTFRDRMGSASREADHAAGATERFGGALRVFADDMDTVRSRMGLARQVAGAAGLPVSGEAVGEPAGMGKADATQVAGYQEASTIVGGARQIEARAHANLASSVATNASDWSMTVLDGLTGTVGGLYGEHLAWTARAAKLERIADQWEHLAGNTTLSDTGRLTALGKSARAELNAEKALGIADSNHGPIKFLPDGFKRAMSANLGESIEDVRYLGRLSSALEKVPYVGLGFTAFGVAMAGIDGQSMTKAAVSSGASFLGATVTTEGLLAGAEALSIAGGPATILAVGAGIAVSYGVEYVVDHYGDDIANAAQNGLHATEHGLQAAGHVMDEGVHKLGHALGHIF
ncbi:MAG TPA: hypothetical protein VFX70_15460 [Mycobacteriales bacterium]|nr:hypothetical protein [Mycobacteriales bacterium]